MNEQQIEQFFELLDAVSEQCGKPKKSMAAKSLMLEVLAEHGFENIRGAIHAHLRDPECGMFDVTTAHIQAQISKAMEKDGRPSSDEAWAIAVRLEDEATTVVTNDEINQAWSVAVEVMPDKTGARMAFKAAYPRLCDAARREHRKPNWFPSLGFDVAARETVLAEAVSNGLLGSEHVQRVLPSPAASIDVPALEHSAKKNNLQETLKALMQIIKSKPPALKKSDEE
jgi:hypothetical protein